MVEGEGDESGCPRAAALILTGSVGSCRGSWLKSGLGSRGVGGNMGREDMSGGGRPVAEGPSGGMAATRSVSFGSSRLPRGVILLVGERSRGCMPPAAAAAGADAGGEAEEEGAARKGLPMLRSTPRSMISWMVMVAILPSLRGAGGSLGCCCVAREGGIPLMACISASASLTEGSGSSLRRWMRHWCFWRCAFCRKP